MDDCSDVGEIAIYDDLGNHMSLIHGLERVLIIARVIRKSRSRSAKITADFFLNREINGEFPASIHDHITLITCSKINCQDK